MKDWRNRTISTKYHSTKAKIKGMVSKKEWEVIEKFETSMIIGSLTESRRLKIFDSILALTKLLEGNSWLELDRNGVELLVAKVMSKYSQNGQETNTTGDHKKALKQWFRYIKLGIRLHKQAQKEFGYGDPKETRFIEVKPVPDKLTREQLITPEEKKKLVESCVNLRDSAMIDVAYDSGCRIGEMLSLQIKHIIVNRHGMTLSVDGKTGARKVDILNSVPRVSKWLEVHPQKSNPEAFLFVNTGNVKKGEPLEYSSARKILKTACKNAKVRPLYWHLFRHTEATKTALTFADATQKKRHGWSPNSRVAARYAHVVDQDVHNDFLRMHGIEPQGVDHQEIPIECGICKTLNSHDSELCHNCAHPLSLDKVILEQDDSQEKVEEQNEQIQNLQSQIDENESLMKLLLDGQQKIQEQMTHNTPEQNRISAKIGSSDMPLINEVWGMVPDEWKRDRAEPPVNAKIVKARKRLQEMKLGM